MPANATAFINSERNNLIMNSYMLDNPAPTEYQDEIKANPKFAGDKRPFLTNAGRFKTIDNGVPGAGTYKLPESCKVKDGKFEHASMRSTVPKGFNNVVGEHNPGVGEYDTMHLKTISNKEF